MKDEFMDKEKPEEVDDPNQWQIERKGGLFNRWPSADEEDESLSKVEAIRHLFDYIPFEYRDLAMSRWRKREVRLVANMLTQIQATNPDRPCYPDLVDSRTQRVIRRGRKIPLSELNIRFMALLRIAEEGQGRDEGMGIFRMGQETDTQGMLKD